MKILLSHRYFWPDTPPYAAMLRTIGEALADAGHEVHVFASTPSYRSGATAPRRERLGRLCVRRVAAMRNEKANLAARIGNAVLYPVALFLHVLRLRPDVVTASTFPPVAAAWMASLAARLAGARFVYHMQDIHPEVSRFAGSRLGRGFVFALMRGLDMQTLRRAAAIVVLSEDMAQTLRSRPGGTALPIRVANNFLLEDFAEGRPPTELVKRSGRVRVVFAGNLGRFQNLPLLASGVATLFDRHPELELLFLGDGTALPELEARWGEHPQVTFGPFLPYPAARELIADADVGLVSLQPGIFRVSYPSKVLTYLGLGLPVLALIEPESALARQIEENDLGTVPDAATPEAIGAALERLLEGPDRRPGVIAYHERELSRPAVLARWRDLIAELER